MARSLLTARWILVDAEEAHEGGGVLVEGGRIARVLATPRAVTRCARAQSVRARDLGDVVLAPGFVDAHAHLELTALADRLPRRGTFAAWIRRLLLERGRLSLRDLRASARSGADRLLAGGTTCVGDIDSSGVVEGALRNRLVRTRIHREVLDLGEPERTRAALALASRPTRRGALRHPGISAHSPYTVSPELLAAVARISRRRRWPVCIHWAETEEETRYLETGLGPFRGLLPESARAGGRPRSGLGRIEAAGLLGPSLTLVHGNHPSRGDLDRVARSGAALVHCPGTHAFFGREPFPIRRWLDAGVPVALGTDGLSSNDDLDMRREMALVRREHPALAPGIVFDLATRAGARALGLAGNIGEIRSGSFADLCAHRVQPGSARDRRALLEALTSGAGAVSGVWVAGRPVAVPLENPAGTSESRGSDAE